MQIKLIDILIRSLSGLRRNRAYSIIIKHKLFIKTKEMC